MVTSSLLQPIMSSNRGNPKRGGGRARGPPTRSGSRSGSRTNSPSSADKDSDDKWTCVRCRKEFTDDESEVLECPRCDMHFCRVCVGLTTEEYKVISNRSDLHWFCPPCELKVIKNMREDKTIEQRCEDFIAGVETRLKKVENSTKKNKEHMDKEIKRLDKKIDDSKKKSQGTGQPPKEAIAKMVKEEIKESDEERKERERRKDNFIVFKMPEPDTTLKEEREKKDREKLISLCTDTLEVNIEDEDLVSVIRLGKKHEENCRPLLVRVRSSELKKNIFTNLGKLADDDETKDYRFDHDQTRKQREELKELVTKAKNMTEEDQTQGWRYLVRGPPWNRKIKKVKVEQEED